MRRFIVQCRIAYLIFLHTKAELYYYNLTLRSELRQPYLTREERKSLRTEIYLATLAFRNTFSKDHLEKLKVARRYITLEV